MERRITILSFIILLIAMIILIIPTQAVAGFWSAGLEVSDSSSRKTITLGTWEVGGGIDPYDGILNFDTDGVPDDQQVSSNLQISIGVPFLHNGILFLSMVNQPVSQFRADNDGWTKVSIGLDFVYGQRYRSGSVVRYNGNWFWARMEIWNSGSPMNPNLSWAWRPIDEITNMNLFSPFVFQNPLHNPQDPTTGPLYLEGPLNFWLSPEGVYPFLR